MPVLKIKKDGEWIEIGGGGGSGVSWDDIQEYVDEAVSSIPTPDVSGQIETHNSDTSAHEDIRIYAKQIGSTKNAVDNSYFINVVNSIGQSSYTGIQGAIDRWYIPNNYTTVTITDTGITVSSSGTAYGALYQNIRNPEYYRGKKVTLSLCLEDGTNLCASYSIPSSIPPRDRQVITLNTSSGDRVGTLYLLTTGEIVVGLTSNISGSQTFKWVALYEGEYTSDSVVVYQPKGYAEELLVCKQFNSLTDEYIGLTPESFGAVSEAQVYDIIEEELSSFSSCPYVVGTTAPSNTNLLWIDTNASTGGLKYYNGTKWVHVPVAYT